MIDTHCHLTFKEFAGRTAQILNEAQQAGVRGAITISTTSTDCLKARDLAAAHANLWCSAGIHPLHSDEPLDWSNVKTAASHPKCIAWGELGLDNHYDRPPREIQHKVLAEQLAFIQDLGTPAIGTPVIGTPVIGTPVIGTPALRAGSVPDDPVPRTPDSENRATGTPALRAGSVSGDPVLKTPDSENRGTEKRGTARPIIVHCREAFDELLSIFRSTTFDPSRFVFHCFTGTPDEARKVLDFGAWISFTGIVTFANATEVAAAAKLVPADRIMVETDSPFLTPEPFRKIRPNEPKYVVHVANHIAKLRGVSPIEFEKQLDSNAERFFGIKLPIPAE